MALSNIVPVNSIADIQAQSYATLSSERQTWAEGALKEFKVPSDTCVKRAILRIHGTFQLTHGGAGVFDEAGFAGRLISLIQLAQGNDTFKNIDPTIARRMQHLISKSPPRKRYATGASAPVIPTAEAADSGAPLAWPTSTHYIYIDEEISIDLEDPLASDFQQKQATLWSTHGKNNCRVRVQCAALSNLSEAGNLGTSAVYGSANINMDLTLVTVPHVRENPKSPFLVLQESLLTLSVPSGSTNAQIQLPKSASKILGMAFQVRDTSSNSKMSDTAIKRVRLSGNGSRNFLDVAFKDLQRINVETFGPEGNRMASGRHNLQGCAMASFRRDGDIASNGIPGDLDSLILGFESSGSADTGMTESGNINVLVAIQELRYQVS